MPTIDPKAKAADAAANAGFSLEGLAGLAATEHPELKQNLEAEGQLPAEAGEPTGGDPEDKPTGEPGDAPEGPPGDPEGEPGTDGEPGDVAGDLQRQQDEAEEKRVADEKAAADAKAAAEAGKDKGAPERDADLNITTDPHLRPATRKVIEEKNAKIVEARNRAEAALREKAELEQKYKEELEALRKTAAPGELPAEVKAELETLRKTVRELDASRDPVFKSKYDDRIAANRKAVLDTLKNDFGLGKDEKGNDDPAALNALAKAGVSLSSLAPHLKKLEEAGYYDEAEKIRETVRENIRLERERAAEIEVASKDTQSRRTQSQQQATAAQQAAAKARDETAARELKAGVDAYQKEFPYMHDPEPPKPGDSETVAAAKRKAVEEFNAIKAKVGAEVARLSLQDAPEDKRPEIEGRIAANAVQHLILKHHVFPRLLKEQVALKARVAELEADLGKFRKAGSVSRAHSAAIKSESGAAKPLPSGVAEGLAEFAKQHGVAVES